MDKLITVFGATGAQGKSVAEALLGDGGYKVRAPTRNPDSSEAKSLGEKGCEVVKVDMDSTDSLEKAITGSYGVLLMPIIGACWPRVKTLLWTVRLGTRRERP